MTELTCIICPIGCRINVIEKTKANSWIIEGNNCPRGAEYAKKEMVTPQRILTAVVQVEKRPRMLPVKSEQPLPKEKLFLAMQEIKEILAKPPIKSGEILKSNLANTGVNLVATKTYL